MALLLIKEIIMPMEYTDFADIFLKELAKVVAKRTSINKHAIKLVNNKQTLYGLIYSLGLVELKFWKTYIESNLRNGFIQSSKPPN